MFFFCGGDAYGLLLATLMLLFILKKNLERRNNMLNQIVIVGRLVKDPEVIEKDNNKKVSNITIAVPRSFKNADGEYESDFINCTLWDSIASNTCEYCKKGDIVGVKGRLQTDNYEKDGEKLFKVNVIAERVTFLSSKKEKEPELA